MTPEMLAQLEDQVYKIEEMNLSLVNYIEEHQNAQKSEIDKFHSLIS
mgnify:CR=1 FL=1